MPERSFTAFYSLEQFSRGYSMFRAVQASGIKLPVVFSGVLPHFRHLHLS